jgi:hypothetical protein
MYQSFLLQHAPSLQGKPPSADATASATSIAEGEEQEEGEEEEEEAAEATSEHAYMHELGQILYEIKCQRGHLDARVAMWAESMQHVRRDETRLNARAAASQRAMDTFHTQMKEFLGVKKASKQLRKNVGATRL